MRKAGNNFYCHLHARLTTFLDHVVPATAGFICQEFRIAGIQPREKSHVVRVIGNHQKIERAGQFDALTG